MSNPPTSTALAQQALNMEAQAGGVANASRIYKIPESTLRNRTKAGRLAGLEPNEDPIADLNDPEHLNARIRGLEAELRQAEKKALTETEVRRTIIGLTQGVASERPPKWTLPKAFQDGCHGVPTLMVSDLHWAEKVFPAQIGGVNEYNLDIARQRLKTLIDRAVKLLKILDPKMRYPGIVIPLGGDMISGNIHQELSESNELNSIPSVLDLFTHVGALIRVAADTFGAVFLPCVSGNHGRDTMKIWAKNRHHTSFDWLLYCFLAKHFENDERVTFFIPDGSDAYYRIYNHRYLLTHGDQFRGGDGMIGALGPIIRGDHKKRSRNAQIDQEYDVMIMGHFHQYTHIQRLIVNGSLKGYDEYAYTSNFGFEPPQQALWLTHPKYGITYRMPVFVDEVKSTPKTSWVSVSR